ncbi:MAG: four helix bundle protein [Anaerolineales bacterium]
MQQPNLRPRISNASSKSELRWPFEKLEVWKLAMELIDIVYKLTEKFPKEERFGLTDQSRRAVVSIANNIAEGKGMYSTKALVEYLYRARGSLYETVTCLMIAEKRNYLTMEERQQATNLAFTLQRKLSGLINSLSKPAGSKSSI